MDRHAEPTNKRYQILVVDDIHEIRLLLRCILEKRGHEVITVVSGEQALRALNEHSPEVIFSDISMDEMNGYELVRHLRLRPDTQKRFIVAMTGDGDRFSEDDSLAAGFDAHLPKPFTSQSIGKTLATFEAKMAAN